MYFPNISIDSLARAEKNRIDNFQSRVLDAISSTYRMNFQKNGKTLFSHRRTLRRSCCSATRGDRQPATSARDFTSIGRALQRKKIDSIRLICHSSLLLSPFHSFELILRQRKTSTMTLAFVLPQRLLLLAIFVQLVRSTPVLFWTNDQYVERESARRTNFSFSELFLRRPSLCLVSPQRI